MSLYTLKLAVAVGLAWFGSAACGAGRKSALPALKDVKSIRIAARPDGEEKPMCKFTTTRKFFLSNSVAWLKKIDWSQKGVALERAQILQPDIDLTVIDKNGKEYRYAFYWSGDSFIDNASNRMLQTKLEPFRIAVIGEIIRHYAARNGKPKR